EHYRHARRETYSGQRRVSARCGARALFRRLFRLQHLHPNSHLDAGARRDHAMATAHGHAEAAMTLIDRMKAEPWRFDFFHTLRQFERANPDRPRIGDSAARRDEYVDLGQVPYLE